jgi:hypothetical protein
MLMHFLDAGKVSAEFPFFPLGSSVAKVGNFCGKRF